MSCKVCILIELFYCNPRAFLMLYENFTWIEIRMVASVEKLQKIDDLWLLLFDKGDDIWISKFLVCISVLASHCFSVGVVTIILLLKLHVLFVKCCLVRGEKVESNVTNGRQVYYFFIGLVKREWSYQEQAWRIYLCLVEYIVNDFLNRAFTSIFYWFSIFVHITMYLACTFLWWRHKGINWICTI